MPSRLLLCRRQSGGQTVAILALLSDVGQSAETQITVTVNVTLVFPDLDARMVQLSFGAFTVAGPSMSTRRLLPALSEYPPPTAFFPTAQVAVFVTAEEPFDEADGDVTTA